MSHTGSTPQVNKSRYNCIEDLALLLEDELRKRIPKINIGDYPLGNGGFHIAGYESSEGQFFQTFWHVHNGKSSALSGKSLDPTIVNANNDIAPTEEYSQMLKAYETFVYNPITIRNGDIEAYVELWDLLFKKESTFTKIVKELGITFPRAMTLEERAKYLKFQIQTIEGIYKFSEKGKGIRGPITTLTITPTEITSYMRE